MRLLHLAVRRVDVVKVPIPQPRVDRLAADWEALADIRDDAQPGWTRQVFTEPYRRSRRWVRERMEDAGLDVAEDGAGNLVGTRAGTRGEGPALVTGSHTDTVAGGGRFDGVIGVLGAIEAVRALRDAGIELHHEIRVVDFLGEEANDFGISCVGSRAIAGALTDEHLHLRDDTGETLGSALGAHTGDDPGAALAAGWRPADVAAFVELHIEQGRRLERRGIPVGVVSAIAGIHRFRAAFDGRPDHAGTTTMQDRRDALAAAAETILAVEQLAGEGADDAVGTAGRVASEPGSINVVPARARLWAEFRSIDGRWLDAVHGELQAAADRAGEHRDVRTDVAWTGTSAPVPASAEVRAAIAGAARACGYPSTSVPSGAGHDAAFLARLGPMGMVFVPSRGGRSHCPEEWTDLDAVAVGVQVLTATLLTLDTRD